MKKKAIILTLVIIVLLFPKIIVCFSNLGYDTTGQEYVGGMAEKELSNHWVFVIGGLFFLLSPFCFSYVWIGCQRSKTKKMVTSFSFEEIDKQGKRCSGYWILSKFDP